MNDWKIKKVRISETMILKMITEGSTFCARVKRGLPRGTQLVNLYFEPLTAAFYAYVTHESFEAVRDGQEVPEIIPLLEDLSHEKPSA